MSNGLFVSEVDGTTHVSVCDSSILDGPYVDKIANELYALIDKQARKRILLDFSQVKFLSSTMIGVLLALHEKANRISGKVIVYGLHGSLHDVLKITRMDKLLNLAESEEEAMSAFGNGAATR